MFCKAGDNFTFFFYSFHFSLCGVLMSALLHRSGNVNRSPQTVHIIKKSNTILFSSTYMWVNVLCVSRSTVICKLQCTCNHSRLTEYCWNCTSSSLHTSQAVHQLFCKCFVNCESIQNELLYMKTKETCGGVVIYTAGYYALVLLVRPTWDQIGLYVAHVLKWVWHPCVIECITKRQLVINK